MLLCGGGVLVDEVLCGCWDGHADRPHARTYTTNSLVAPEETPAGYLEAHAAALASAAAGAQPRPPAPAEAAAAAVTLDGLGAFYLALSSATFCVPGGGGGVGEMGGQQHADVMAFGKACTRLRVRWVVWVWWRGWSWGGWPWFGS